MAKVELELVHPPYGFDTIDELGNVVKMDTKPEMGGENYGGRPMQLLLNALAGCSSVDVINILKKQKQELSSFHVSVDGERVAQDDISLWKNIKMTFTISGKVTKDKAEKAVKLSIEKYCSVAATLVAAGAIITSEVIIEN